MKYSTLIRILVWSLFVVMFFDGVYFLTGVIPLVLLKWIGFIYLGGAISIPFCVFYLKYATQITEESTTKWFEMK